MIVLEDLKISNQVLTPAQEVVQEETASLSGKP